MQITIVVRPETAAWLRARAGSGVGQIVDDLVARAMSREDPVEYDEVS